MLEQLTPTEYNRELTERAIKALTHLANTMNECYYLFYARNTQVILDSMNANIALTLERFAANSQLGAAVNSQLEKTDVTSRVIVSMPTGYGFEDGKFAYTAPVVTAPEPEPEPEPEA
jgi:hypothetical protein